MIICQFVLLTQIMYGQSLYSFSIQEAEQYAFENNYDLISASKDIEIAKNTVKEYLSAGFPQLNATIMYNDYLALPTFILPAGSFGPGTPEQKVQFGTKYTGYGEAILNQLIFDGRYILGVKASRKLVEKSEKEYRRQEIDIKQEVATAYSTVIIAEKNSIILDTTLKEMKKMLYETTQIFEAGFLEDTDVDQLELIVADLESKAIISENRTLLAYSYLKFILGLNLNDSIVLKDGLNEILDEEEFTALFNEVFDHTQNIDYRILKTQEELALMNLKATKSEYYPTINAFLTYQAQAQRDQWDFLNPQGAWYPTSIFGVEMIIPIWSSGYRSSRVQQARLNLEKLQINDNKMETGLNIQAITAKADFKDAYFIYINKKSSLGIASKIYIKTTEKYKEGISSSMDLLNAHNQFLTTETEYMLSILDLMETKLVLEKLLTKN